MATTLVWDLPTRLFHWALAAGFAAAAGISLGLGEHSPLFPYHSLIGLTLAFMVALRVVWGIVGTRYARFGSFMFGPGAVVKYMRQVVRGGGTRWIGHNPGSACAIFAMLALLGALAVTGVMLGLGREGAKEVHEWCAYAMLAVVGVHVLGVLVHTVRMKENITLGMMHGRKHAGEGEGIVSARPLAAAVLGALVVAWAVGLVSRYDAGTGVVLLPVIGTELRLLELEREGERRGEPGGEHTGEDD